MICRPTKRVSEPQNRPVSAHASDDLEGTKSSQVRGNCPARPPRIYGLRCVCTHSRYREGIRLCSSCGQCWLSFGCCIHEIVLCMASGQGLLKTLEPRAQAQLRRIRPVQLSLEANEQLFALL